MAKARVTLNGRGVTVLMTERDRDVALAFNKWMQQYRNDPSSFAREFQIIEAFAIQQQAGEAWYGTACVLTLNGFLKEVRAEKKAKAVRPKLYLVPPPLPLVQNEKEGK